MKITFVTSGTIKSNFTYRVLQLARSLKVRGHEVSIICPIADKYNNFKPEKIREIDGVKIIQPFQFKSRRMELNLFPYMFHAAYCVFRNKSDYVYIYKPTPISIVGLLAKFFHGSKIILDMDDLGSEVMEIEGRPVYQVKLVEWCEKICAHYADRIVTASTYLERRFRNIFPKKPILVMSNAVETEWFAPVNFSQEKNRIVFLGAINRQSILEPLFDVLPAVLEKIPDLKVLIIGDGTFLEYFKKKVEYLGLSGSIEFTGWMDISLAQKKLHSGDIGYNYMPNENTTKAASNMKVPQYMARGVLPLVSDIGDLPAYTDNGRVGYVAKADNLQSLEETIIYALQDVKRQNRARDAAIFSANNFNWNLHSEKFEKWLGQNDVQKKVKDGKKVVYVLTITVPGSVGGAEIRNFQLLKQWGGIEDVDPVLFCVSTKNTEGDKRNIEMISFAETHLVPRSERTLFRGLKSIFLDQVPPFMNDFEASGIGDVFRRECEERMPDIVQLEQLHAYYMIRDHIPWLKSHGVKILFDCHNVEFRAFQESLNVFSLPKRIVGQMLIRSLYNLEIEATEASDVIIACSDSDAKFFSKYNKNTHVIPNGVDTKEFKQERRVHGHSIIFMGGIGYPPNEDAIRFYLSEIHPIIKNQIPDVKFLAIGVDEKWLVENQFQDSSILPLGFVDDVNPYLHEASVGLCPIRYGSGTRLKILSYMGASLPVVSTTKGAEGVGYIPGRDILIEDDPAKFADAVVELLHNRASAERIGKNGYDFVLKNYEWEVIGKKLVKIYNTLT